MAVCLSQGRFVLQCFSQGGFVLQACHGVGVCCRLEEAVHLSSNSFVVTALTARLLLVLNAAEKMLFDCGLFLLHTQ